MHLLLTACEAFREPGSSRQNQTTRPSLTSLARAAGPRHTCHRPILFLPVLPKAPRYRQDYSYKHLVLPSVSPHLLSTYKEPQSLPRISLSTCHSSAQEPGMTPYYLLHPIVI